MKSDPKNMRRSEIGKIILKPCYNVKQKFSKLKNFKINSKDTNANDVMVKVKDSFTVLLCSVPAALYKQVKECKTKFAK